MTHVNAWCALPGIVSVHEAAHAMRDPDIGSTTLPNICNHDLTTVAPAARVEPAVRFMAEKATCCLPAVVGDLVVECDPDLAFGEFSTVPPPNA
jgi:predicted transcriptional regulator